MGLEEWKDYVATTASFSTVLLFMTGIFTVNKIIARRSVGNDSSLQFVAGSLSCSLWFRYGLLIEDSTLILVNFIGLFLNLSYSAVFFYYSKIKRPIVQQVVGITIAFLLTLLYIRFEEDIEAVKFRVGFFASMVTITFFGAPLVQLMHVIRTRNVECLPFSTILGSLFVSAQWVLYGFILNNTFVVLPNALACVLSAVQLSLFAVYPSIPEHTKLPL